MPAKIKKQANATKANKDVPVAAAPLEMSAKVKTPTVSITQAKGRPMLSWVGKRALRSVTAFPAQHIETFDPLEESAKRPGGLLFHGDNKEILAHLLANGYRGQIKLIYIDPPFDSGADYVRKVTLRGPSGKTKIEGENYTLGEQIQYTDIWANDNYLQFMYERLMLMKELLHDEQGFIGLQCDWRKAHHLRCLLDEVFGSENFRGEILIRAGTKNVQSQFEEVSSLTTGNNSIFLYSKSRDSKLPKLIAESVEHEPGKWDTFWRGTDRPTMRYELFGKTPADGQWRWEKNRAEQAVRNYEEYLRGFAKSLSLDDYYVTKLDNEGTDLDFVRKDNSGTVQYYVSPRNYKLLSNVWFDIPYRGTKTNYPTEKSEEPLIRLISWLTKPDGLVLDCFIGSGTTAAVSQKMGRRWIGCDINKGAIQTTSKRLQEIIKEQIKAGKKSQAELIETESATPKPAQLSFGAWRVNDYDLQIQHNEAVNLVCEHIGIERKRTDTFFDGMLGKSLVKVIPFSRPLTPLDFDELKRELDARPDEDRPVTLVCLGMEIASHAWLENWNRLRKSSVNKINVIELRTDSRYGKLIAHKPAQAKISIERKKDKITVEIQDFISPTIIERLQEQAGLLKPQIDNWQAMVDCVMIDTAYDSKVFKIALSDLPEKKTDFVSGKYELPAPGSKTAIAVKIIDMLGEEVLTVKEI